MQARLPEAGFCKKQTHEKNNWRSMEVVHYLQLHRMDSGMSLSCIVLLDPFLLAKPVGY